MRNTKSSVKTKIAIVCGTMDIGGGEMRAAKLAGYIDKSKFDIKYFIIEKYIENQISKLLNDTQVDYICLNLPSSINIKAYKKFSEALRDFAPDVVHEHLVSPYSWVWCILNNKPLVSTLHSDPFRRKDKRVATVIKLKSLQGNLKIIGCSQKTASLVKACYRVKDKYVGHIYNPIEVDKYKPTKYPRGGEISSLVAIGRFSRVKNFPLMLRAFKRVLDSGRSAELFIAGSGPLQEETQNLAKELGLSQNVHFLGNVSDIPELLGRMDALLLSSVSEACPMVILEAMAAGLPVVATDVGGVPELVTDNGIVVKSQDEVGFANAIITLLDEPNRAVEMHDKALNYAVQYDKSVIARQYEEEYSKLTKKV